MRVHQESCVSCSSHIKGIAVLYICHDVAAAKEDPRGSGPHLWGSYPWRGEGRGLPHLEGRGVVVAPTSQ